VPTASSRAPVPMRSQPGRNLGPGVERGSSQPSYRLSCRCTYKVRCEVASYGDGLAMLEYFDDEEASATRGERVWRCPGCHSLLSLLSFRS
jgi:hypothetical protein